MATVRVRIAILTVRITLSVCPFNRMAHTANNGGNNATINQPLSRFHGPGGSWRRRGDTSKIPFS
jgi:hypothetical protein